jgi:hypothetical protein
MLPPVVPAATDCFKIFLQTIHSTERHRVQLDSGRWPFSFSFSVKRWLSVSAFSGFPRIISVKRSIQPLKRRTLNRINVKIRLFLFVLFFLIRL